MAKKVKQPKELKLEDILFNCRDQLRGKASMADKRDLLLTLVFLRFVGEKFTKQRAVIYNEQIAKGRNPETDAEFIASKMEYKPAYAKAGVFYLPEECRWETISALNADATLPMTLDNIINSLELDNASLKGALPQKIFSSAGIAPKDLKAVIDEVGKISQERFPERDLIGRVYEYFLQAFAFQVKDSKEEGEFYTPHTIVNLIASIIEPIDGTIYDPCCGSGGMFVQSMKVIEAHGGNTKAVSVYGQEIQPETFRLAKMNLAVRGISHDLGNEPASTFLNDKHRDKKMDYVITNPPFNLKKWRTEDELRTDPRWDGYEIPPVSNANYAWILHILNKLNVRTGIAGFLLANCALDDEDTIAIRKKLIENDKVEAIILLPRDMFYTTDISVTLWIVNQNKKGGMWHGRNLRDRSGEVLFLDLRTWNQNIYEKKYVELKDDQVQRICDIYHTWQTTAPKGGSIKDGNEWRSLYCEPELYYAASKEEILEKNGSLAPSRYIEFVDKDNAMDYRAVLNQFLEDYTRLHVEWENNHIEIQEVFKPLDNSYNKVPLSAIVTQFDIRNKNNFNYPVLGVNKDKIFMPTAANMDGVDTSKYKVIRKGEFVFSGMQTGRDMCIRLALYSEDTPALISPAYTTFRISDNVEVLPEYLYICFNRSESDRYGAFLSDSSIRANLDWEKFLSIEIPVPSIESQKEIVSVYLWAKKAQKIADEASQKIKEICPALVQHVIHSNL